MKYLSQLGLDMITHYKKGKDKDLQSLCGGKPELKEIMLGYS